MGNRYRLVELGNSELLAGLSELVRQSNVLTAQVLAHLVELEERMLHLELGFSSLFAYCVEALGMSEGTAGRRVTATRVCRRFPEVFARVARGELHLCALCALAPHLNPENSAELFDACRGKTRRQIEELLAARFPRPDVREQIRRLPVRVQVPAGAAASELMSLPSGAVDASAAPATVVEMPAIAPNSVLLPIGGAVSDGRRRAREFEPLSADRFGVHFTADAELRELIERARALASHRLPNGDLASLMKLMAASFVRQEEKRRFGIGARPRRADAKSEKKIKNETNTQPANSTEQRTPPGGVPVSLTPTETTTPEARAAHADRRSPDLVRSSAVVDPHRVKRAAGIRREASSVAAVETGFLIVTHEVGRRGHAHARQPGGASIEGCREPRPVAEIVGIVATVVPGHRDDSAAIHRHHGHEMVRPIAHPQCRPVVAHDARRTPRAATVG